MTYLILRIAIAGTLAWAAAAKARDFPKFVTGVRGYELLPSTFAPAAAAAIVAAETAVAVALALDAASAAAAAVATASRA